MLYTVLAATLMTIKQFMKVLLPTDAQKNCFKKHIKIYIITVTKWFGVIAIITERTI